MNESWEIQMATEYRFCSLPLLDCVFHNCKDKTDRATQHVIKEYLVHIFVNILINKLVPSIANQ